MPMFLRLLYFGGFENCVRGFILLKKKKHDNNNGKIDNKIYKFMGYFFLFLLFETLFQTFNFEITIRLFFFVLLWVEKKFVCLSDTFFPGGSLMELTIDVCRKNWCNNLFFFFFFRSDFRYICFIFFCSFLLCPNYCQILVIVSCFEMSVLYEV